MPSRTVADAPLGATLSVASIAAEGPAQRRLAELGIRPGARVAVLRRTAGGGRILGVADSRVALDAGTARTITLLGTPE
ncbi:MAG: ferrous iron transport protein A [Actinobacteria bacterium]|nr:ferrous iron transport protein A [Actinomycetota bacterium]